MLSQVSTQPRYTILDSDRGCVTRSQDLTSDDIRTTDLLLRSIPLSWSIKQSFHSSIVVDNKGAM